MRDRLLSAATALLLAGCALPHRAAGPAPAAAPPRAVVALSDVINNIKCDMLGFESGNQYLTTLGRSLGGAITVTIDRAQSRGGGVAIGVPIASVAKLTAGVSAKSERDFGETLTIPFVMTYEEAKAAAVCPDLRKDGAARAEVAGTAANGDAATYHLNGPLLNLVALREQIQRIYAGNPKIGLLGFEFAGTIVLVDDARADLGLDVLFLKPALAASVSDSYKISYRIGTNWQRIIKDGKYLDDSGASQMPDAVVTSFAPPPPPPMPPQGADAPPAAAAPKFRLDATDGAIGERQAADYIRALGRADTAPPR